MGIALALLAAFGFAIASVFQQRIARAVPREHALRASLLVELATNGKWLLATAIDAGAFVVEAVALNVGSLALVQALLATSLLFALPISAALLGHRLSRTEWWGAGAVAAGIVVFLLVAAPGEGRSQAPASVWVAFVAIAAASMLILIIAGVRSRRSPVRAGCWAAAGAIAYAFTAAVLKSGVDVLGTGIGAFVTSWQAYALAVAAVTGTLLVQSAFQTGELSASMPILVVVEPVSGALVGSLVFLEGLRHTPLALVAMGLAMLVMAAGVFTLSRSPLARYLA